MKKIICLFFMLAFLRGAAHAYDGAAFLAEKDTALAARDSMAVSLLPVAMASKKSVPIFTQEGSFVYSLDISYGQSFTGDYNYDLSALKLLGGVSYGISSNGLLLPSVSGNVSLGLPFGLIATLNCSGFPDLSVFSVRAPNFKADVNLYCKFSDENWSWIGAFAGVGYGYTTGAFTQDLTGAYAENGTNNAYAGALSTRWGYHSLSAELFLYKTLVVVNFYLRANYILLLGGSSTTLAGSFNGQAQTTYRYDANSPVSGLVTGAGMEVAITWYKGNVEIGKDWLNNGMFFNTGFRIGF